LVNLLIGVVASIEVNKAFEGCVFFVFEFGLDFLLFSDVCNFFEEVGEDIGGCKLISLDGIVHHFDVGIVFLAVGGCKLQFLFAAYLLSLLGVGHHHAFDLVLEVVDVWVPADSFDEVALGFKRVLGLASGVWDGLDVYN
jgi:hypothetical protein